MVSYSYLIIMGLADIAFSAYFSFQVSDPRISFASTVLSYVLSLVATFFITKRGMEKECDKIMDSLKKKHKIKTNKWKSIGEYQKAFKKWKRFDAERTGIHNLMGFCHFKRKEHEKAIACFQKVIALDPSSAIGYANIASNYRDMGEKENAIQYYMMALTLDPSTDFARKSLMKLKG